MAGSDTHARPEEKVVAVSDKIKGPQGVIKVPYRILMGPGPSNANPRILSAQTLPLLGHLHPPFLAIMDEIKAGLQYAFQTESKYTLLISGTGHAGMELCLANMLEPGQKVVIGNNGIWGERCADMAKRYDADVVELKCAPGKSLSFEEVKQAVEEHKPALLFLCQVGLLLWVDGTWGPTVSTLGLVADDIQLCPQHANERIRAAVGFYLYGFHHSQCPAQGLPRDLLLKICAEMM
ncbi:hypothetical protein WJX84_004260 [Apatococcus fuscideae]|uniref:Aminotransferase class V domain-containing protein n=1 Tax=Apatococcus fuscideae TaxID=2026836 RepID=A0AAW1SPK3_9CHLO